MGSTRRARILLKACLGQLLANAPVQAQGEAWLAMAKCEMAEVSCSSTARKSGSSESGGAVGQGGGDGRVGAGAGTGAGAGAGAPGIAQRGEALKRAVLHLDRAIAILKRCHDFAGLRECFYLKVGSCPREVQGHSSSAKAERVRAYTSGSYLVATHDRCAGAI